MARNAGKAPGSNGPAPEPTPEGLDQVRDILFGGQMRMVDARLQGLETRLQQEQAQMRAEFTRELEELDGAMKKNVAQLNERLQAERTKRTEDLKALSADFKELLKGLERRHQSLEEAASMADAELRDHLLKQSAAQSAELAKTADRFSMQLELMATALQTEKLDTAALATGLTDLVSRLTGNGNAGKRSQKG